MPEDKLLYIPAGTAGRRVTPPVNAHARAGVSLPVSPGVLHEEAASPPRSPSLAACTTTNPDVIQRYDAQRLSQVQDATVLTVRPVVVDGSQSGIGGTSGAVIGGVAGSSVGGSREAIAVGVIGAVAGAVVGNAIERAGTREDAFEILVQLRNGERRAIVQAKGSETNPATR